MVNLAFWYSPDAGFSDEKDIELHFNLWKLPNGWRKHSRFLDIGIKLLDSTKGIKSLRIFVPGTLQESDIEDLGTVLCSDPKLLSAVFNEDLQTLRNPTNKEQKVFDKNSSHLFSIYRLNEGDLKIEHRHGGTILSVAPMDSSSPLYYRLRVKGAFLSKMSTPEVPANAFLQSAFSKQEVIDFRVNEARALSLSLLDEMRKEQVFALKKAHFFFVCSSREEIVESHTPFSNCRHLERDTWREYLKNYNLFASTNLAYHWKWSDKANRCNVLIKTRYEHNNFQTIVKYLVFLTIFSIFANYLSYFVIPRS